jgi:DNA-directed RNA polymerase specialized sigma subunit
MSPLSKNNETKHILRDDINFLLHLVADPKKMQTFPLTEKGKVMLKMLWEEKRSFTSVAEELSLSKGRVMQIYHLELRRLTYFIDATFQEFSELKKENEALKAKKIS